MMPESCRFRPSQPPWPSQMCAGCGEWRDDHQTPRPEPQAQQVGSPAGGGSELRAHNSPPAVPAALASEVWDILVAECGASEAGREAYRLEVARRGWPEEWRFIGALGFGGKIRHDPHGDRLYVDCYREDETPERLAMVDRANQALKL